jgi:hypothetical protein
MPIPEEFYEPFRMFSKAVQVVSIRLPRHLKLSQLGQLRYRGTLRDKITMMLK